MTTQVDHVAKDREEAQRYIDAFIAAVNEDHLDVIPVGRDIGCMMRDEIERLRRVEKLNAPGPSLLPEEAKPAEDGAMSGIEIIAAERRRQVAVEGWTPEHDDTHSLGEISRAAIAYATRGFYQVYGSNRLVIDSPLGWPWDKKWFKPSADDPMRNLAKAGALIAAEIDRLKRAKAARSEQVGTK